MSFSDTVDLERSFLKAVTGSIIQARTFLHQAREEYFTTEPRKFIFAFATRYLNESNSLLTKKLFEYEVEQRMDESPAASFIGEFNMIQGADLDDPIEAVIAKLRDAVTGRKALELSTDVIELLGKGKIEEAVTHLKREVMMLGGHKKDRPIVPLTDIAERLALLRDKQAHPEKYHGIKTGFKTFDDITGGLFPGEMTLLAGITGTGKSTMCRNFSYGVINSGPNNVLYITNEEYLEQVQYKFDSLLTGIKYKDFKLAKITEEDLDRWQKYMQNDMLKAGMGQVFIKELAAFTNTIDIEQEYRALENRGIPIHVIIVDHLPNVKPIQQAWGENDEMKKAAADVKELARSLRVAVVVPTQAATEVEKKQTQGKRAGKLDVFGSKGQIHVANTFLIITYRGVDDTQTDREEYYRDVFFLCDVKKQRDGPPFSFHVKHIVESGKIVEIADPSKKAIKEAKDAMDANLKEAGEKTAQPAPPVVASVAAPVALAGTRDGSMKTLAVIEGDDEEDEEDITPAAQESQDTAPAPATVKEEEDKWVKEMEVSQADVEYARLEEARKAAEKNTTLGRLHSKNIQLGGVQ